MKKYDVFISYRNVGDGHAYACVLSNLLSDLGYSVYIDHHNLHASHSKGWSNQLRDAMKNSRNILFVLSKDCFNDHQDITTVEEERNMDFFGEIVFAHQSKLRISAVRTPDWVGISESDRGKYHESIGELLNKQIVKFQMEDGKDDKSIKEIKTLLGTTLRKRIVHKCLSFSVFVVLLTAIITYFATAFFAPTDTTVPTVTITKFSLGENVKAGESGSFKIYFDDERKLKKVDIEDRIVLHGFTATQSTEIQESDDGYVVTLYLNNIQGQSGNDNYITVLEGAAIDGGNNKSLEIESPRFNLYNSDDELDNEKPIVSFETMKDNYFVDGTIKFRLKVTDNRNFSKHSILLENYIMLNNFTGNVKSNLVEQNENMLIFEVIISELTKGENCCIAISKDLATDSWGNESNYVFSQSFNIS